jgi:hypothetical protein
MATEPAAIGFGDRPDRKPSLLLSSRVAPTTLAMQARVRDPKLVSRCASDSIVHALLYSAPVDKRSPAGGCCMGLCSGQRT